VGQTEAVPRRGTLRRWAGAAFFALACALGHAPIQALGPVVAERELNAGVIAAAPVDTAAAAKRRAEERKRQEGEAKTPRTKLRAHFTSAEDRERESDEGSAKAEAERLRLVRRYISLNMSLESVRVAAGERSGKSTERVFGTVVNKGARTLRRVKVRIYFLDGSGRRIGELECSPGPVTDVPNGGNTLSPLRPGSRRDFACDVEASAPSGWSEQVQAEIVDIEFSDK
jgi:hypothetical protein